MKILAIGDFHGKYPKKINTIIKKEKIDLIISSGDYPPFAYRSLWFKHCYGTDKDLSEVIGEKKYKQLIVKDHEKGEIPLKALNKLNIPVLTVLGNIDYPAPNDIKDWKQKKNLPNWDKHDTFSKRMQKYTHIKRIDYKAMTINSFVFIGMRGHSAPGSVKSKAFKKHKEKLEKIFKKYKKEKIIFISHNVPYNTKLDKITSKHAPKMVRGKHYGSKLAKSIIKKFQPIIAIGGHIHESKGKDKIKKTICINPGAIHEGNYAIIDLKNENKPKITFT